MAKVSARSFLRTLQLAGILLSSSRLLTYQLQYKKHQQGVQAKTDSAFHFFFFLMTQLHYRKVDSLPCVCEEKRIRTQRRKKKRGGNDTEKIK